jgi:hypothetical protein
MNIAKLSENHRGCLKKTLAEVFMAISVFEKATFKGIVSQDWGGLLMGLLD